MTRLGRTGYVHGKRNILRRPTLPVVPVDESFSITTLMFARGPNRDDRAWPRKPIHELPSDTGGNPSQLTLAQLEFLLAFDYQSQVAAHHQIDLLLLAMAVDAQPLSRLKGDLVDPEACNAERLP